MEIPRKTKSEIFNVIISYPSFLGKYEEYDGILTFLSKIWDLKQMPSEDNRYKNAYDDTWQHIVNNQDWTFEYLFLERLSLIEGDEKYFVLFIEAIVHPTVRKSKDEILLLVSKINKIIHSTGYRLILTDYFEDLPVHKFKNSAEFLDLPIDIMPNKIPIYWKQLDKNKNEYPSFILYYDHWDDFGFKTMFDLNYKENESSIRRLGKIKIMKRDTQTTSEALPETFFSLTNDYCSLGQSKDYYQMLKIILGDQFHSFLLAIRDVAVFPKINEIFENDNIFRTSLIRDNEAERLARKIRFEIEGISEKEYYKFNYTHKPSYSENTIQLNFDFEYTSLVEHRVYALIGKNGTGKTKILSSLAKSLSEKEPLNFSPRKPVYGKIFTVSYSFFDNFEIPTSDASFNYVYCGLKKTDGTWKSKDDLLVDFYRSVSLIKTKKLEYLWYDILRNFIVPEILDIAFSRRKSLLPDSIFDESKFNEIYTILSSGQSIILFMISEIISQIRYDSLILFDEPETHLHPNAISSLLNTIFRLVKRFESFCIIATHSPLIIQEIPARNIFIIERENNIAFVRELERESFGENLTVITQDIFGNKEISKHFISLIEELIKQGKSYSEIISAFESDKLPISSNIRLYIKSLIPKV